MKACLFVVLAVAVIAATGCAGQAKVATTDKVAATPEVVAATPKVAAATLSTLYDKTWLLTNILTNGKQQSFNRRELDDNLSGWFSLTLTDGKVSGVGAPNRFTGTVTTEKGNALSISRLASTMMIALKTAPDLSEHDYFDYLAGVTGWEYIDGCLILDCKTSKGLSCLQYREK
jgi:heat shock protein HslJ